MAYPTFRSGCPVASGLDLFGDRWTLLVIRGLLTGRRRFGELLAMEEGIATNVLAERLERLERYGIVSRTPYQDHPRRHAYRLTRRGADLLPVLQAIAVWGLAHIPGRDEPPPGYLTAPPEAFYPDGAADRP